MFTHLLSPQTEGSQKLMNPRQAMHSNYTNLTTLMKEEKEMSEWITPINNRTQEDVDKVKMYDELGYENLDTSQQQEWISGMIGALNATDMNRIENNISYINELLSVRGETSKTDWTMLDIFGEQDAKRIIVQIKSLITRFDLLNAPEVPDSPLNVYTKINDIETLLLMMYEKWYRNVQGYFLTNDNNYLVTNNNERFKVLEDRRGKFITNDSKVFVSTDGALSVFTSKI